VRFFFGLIPFLSCREEDDTVRMDMDCRHASCRSRTRTGRFRICDIMVPPELNISSAQVPDA
jgi:hypothetical protein